MEVKIRSAPYVSPSWEAESYLIWLRVELRGLGSQQGPHHRRRPVGCQIVAGAGLQTIQRTNTINSGDEVGREK